MSVVSVYSDELGLSGNEQRVLRHLLDEANDQGVIDGFNLTRCASEMKLGAGSGRRTLGRWLAGLAAAGVVVYEPARSGTALGFLQVVEIGRLRSDSSARQRALSARCDPDPARVSAPLARAEGLDPARVSAPSARAATRAIRKQDLLQEEEPKEGRKGLDRALTSNPENPDRDWTDQEFPDLVAPLVTVCVRNPNLTALDRPAPVLAALRPFARAQVAHAVDLVRRRAETGKCASPFGFLHSRAKALDPVYFPADVAAAADKWSEPF